MAETHPPTFPETSAKSGGTVTPRCLSTKSLELQQSPCRNYALPASGSTSTAASVDHDEQVESGVCLWIQLTEAIGRCRDVAGIQLPGINLASGFLQAHMYNNIS